MAISFEKLNFYYKSNRTRTIALENISLNIKPKGEFICIVGRTGSGKTSLLQHMNALLKPDSGKATIFDTQIIGGKKKKMKLNHIRRRVGLVFQFPEYQLFAESVLKDVMFGPKNFKNLKKDAEELAKKSLEIVGFPPEMYEKSPFKLSGGEQRKVAIAGILAMKPEILLLDEPTRGLDPRSQHEIMELFYKIFKETGNTTILISHDMDIVSKYATRVIVLNGSRLAYDGDKEGLFLTDIYKENYLNLPSTLEIKKHLEKELGIKINSTFDIEELIKELTDK